MFFIFLILEILIFSVFLDQYGFLETLGLYFAPSLLGLLLLVGGSSHFLFQLQAKLSSGQRPEKALFFSAARFVAAILLISPFFFTRILAILLLLPGVKHLIFWYLTSQLIKKTFGPNVFQFRFGGWGNGTQSEKWSENWSDKSSDKHANQWPSQWENKEFRDIHEATVVDVKPKGISHKNETTNE